MSKTVLLLASVSLSVLLVSGAALAVTLNGGTTGSAEADTATATKGPDAALDRAL